MTSHTEQLELAARHHRSGNLDRAEEIYRLVLKDVPDSTDALHLLGVVHHQRGENASAIENIRKAISLAPDTAEYHTNLGSVFLAMGKTEEAIQSYREALKHSGDDPDIHFNLGNLYSSTRQHIEAIDSYRQAVKIAPLRADLWNNLGRVTQKIERWKEAAECYRNAMKLAPTDFEPVNNLGVVYEKIGNFKLAYDCFCRATRLRPTSADVNYNAGNLARKLYRYEKASEHYRLAIRHRVQFVEAYANLAATYVAMGELRKAIELYDRFLVDDPEHPEIRFNKSLIMLRLENFETGWNEYEWRWKYGDTPERIVSPQWTGTDLSGKTILVTAEQGIGDQIMFASCLQEVIEKAGVVHVECEERLLPIFERSFSDVSFIPVQMKNRTLQVHRPTIDLEIPFGSLPRFLRTSENAFPVHERYLLPDENRRDGWKKRLREMGDSLKIGISWRGGKDEETRTMRSIPLEQWSPLLDLPNVSFVNLQYGETTVERRAFCDRTGSSIQNFPQIDPLSEIDNFAALISALDLVISIDNSTVHLAGALGIPCLVMLPHYADWRWFSRKQDSLWYRSLRLFRQESVEGWNDVFDRILEHLRSIYDIESKDSETVTLKFSAWNESA